MKSVSITLAKLIFALSILLLLSACGSELTGIDAPPTVENNTPFEVSVTHQFFDADEAISPTSTPSGALVFGVFFPDGWSASPNASYEGSWDGVAQNLTLELQAGIPATNLLEYLVAEESPPEEILTLIELSDCETVINDLGPETEGFQLAFYQTTAPLFEGPEPQIGDGGEFTFELTPAGNEDGDEIIVIHGLLIGAPGSEQAEIEEDILGCSWYPDEDLIGQEGDWIPDAEFAAIMLFGQESLPVPVMGGAMIALLSVLLGLMGVLIGRRRTKHTS